MKIHIRNTRKYAPKRLHPNRGLRATSSMSSTLGREEISRAERVWERLWTVLYTSSDHYQAYVYRLDAAGQSIGSYIWRGPAWPELPEILRDAFLGGDFRVLIRNRRKMVFAGNISIGRPNRAFPR